MEVELKFARINPWAGISKYKNCYDYIGPYFTRAGNIYTGLSEEDARMLGFNYPEIKPEYIILSEIPVPPISVRPSVMLPGSTTPSEDDITFALSNILKANTAIIGDVLTSLIIDIIRNIVVREVEKWIMILKCYVLM